MPQSLEDLTSQDLGLASGNTGESASTIEQGTTDDFKELGLGSGGMPQRAQVGLARLAKWDPLFEASGQKYKVDPTLLKAWALQESSGHPDAVSDPAQTINGVPARGLMQIQPVNYTRYGISDPSDPGQSIDAAAHMLRDSLDKNKGDLPVALQEYFGGTDRKQWGAKTAQYPKDVLGWYKDLGGDPVGLSARGGALPPPPSAAPTTPVSAKPLAPPAGPQIGPEWDYTENLLNAALLGGGVPLRAAGYATGKVMEDLAKGVPIRQAIENNLGSDYRTAARSIEAKRDAWEKANPGAAAYSNVVGSAPATLGAMAAGQEYVAAPLAEALSGPMAQVTKFTGKMLPEIPGFGAAASATPEAVTVASKVPGVVKAAAAAVPKIIAKGTVGAAEGAGVGAAQSGLYPGSTGEQTKTGAIVGALANPILGYMAGPIASGIEPVTAVMAKKFAELVPSLRAGQIKGAPGIVTALDNFFRGGAGDAQRKQFFQGVSHTFGEDSPVINNDLVENAKARIGAGLNGVAANTKIAAGDVDLLTDLHGIKQDATQNLIDDKEVSAVHKAADSISHRLLTGDISGTEYQNLTKKGGALMNSEFSRNPNIRQYSAQIRDSLDEALARSSAPDQINTLKALRGQWRNMKIVDGLTDETTGAFDPTKLIKAVERQYGTTAKAGDLGTLAEGGANFMTKAAPAAKTDASGVKKFLTSPMGLLGEGALGLGTAEHLGLGFHQLATPEGIGALALGGGAYAGAGAIHAATSMPAFRNMLLRKALNPQQFNPFGMNPALMAAVGLTNNSGVSQ